MSAEPGVRAEAIERLRRIGGDTLVRQMVELYLTNGADRVRALLDSAASADTDGVERAAHTMKTSAGNVGAAQLQQAAEMLERLAAAGSLDHDLVARVVRAYEESADALRTVLRERTA